MFLTKNIEELYNKFANRIYEPDVLDGKTKELIALACSVMADCVPCIEYHYKKALGFGAAEDEVLETLAITMSVSAGSKKARYGKIFDELKEKNKNSN